jgi:hypothetical protein
MQTVSDEGHERAGAPAAGGTGGVDEDSYEVELRGGGWSGAIGRLEEYTIKTQRTRVDLLNEDSPIIVWECLQIPEFFIAPAAALLIAQGMQLRELFPDSSYFITRPSNLVFSNGPYIFLKGQLTKPHSPPPRLLNVVLAHVTRAPEGMPMEKLMGLLLQLVL